MTIQKCIEESELLALQLRARSDESPSLQDALTSVEGAIQRMQDAKELMNDCIFYIIEAGEK